MEESRKRALEETPYYKIRSLLKKLRPNFIEVLKTPDFRNCKEADEIRAGMKVMMELYKELAPASTKLQQSDVAPGYSSNVQNDGKNDQTRGSYIVGGSAIGWNFVTFPGTTAIYYGQTKEAYRAANPTAS